MRSQDIQNYSVISKSGGYSFNVLIELSHAGKDTKFHFTNNGEFITANNGKYLGT